MNSLEQLSQFSTIVADSGEINMIKLVKPQDATTNPSLIYKASQKDEYRSLVENAVNWAKQRGGSESDLMENIIDKLSINFGLEILQHVPGYVSTEIDADLSFDKESTVKRAIKIIRIYESEGISKDRILVKVAATWEGIKASEELMKHGIQCNLTLIFNLAQAVACAENYCFLISPFVGRISDWHKQRSQNNFEASQDPGVLSVKNIYNYYKKFNYKTVIMGASFRNIEQIIELAGCDRLTLSPDLINKLASENIEISKKLTLESAQESDTPRIKITEPNFRNLLNDDEMATTKLSDGIRIFKKDHQNLINYIKNNFF